MKLTYQQLMEQLHKAIKDNPDMATEYVTIYQTDNRVTHLEKIQLDMGNCLIAIRYEY